MKKSTFSAILLLIFGFVVSLSLVAQQQHPQSFSYKSPVPGANYATPHHSIALRQGEPLDITTVHESSIEVTGSVSGPVSGVLTLSSDSRTLIFKPDSPLQFNETVSVSIQEGIKTITGQFITPESYSFSTMQEDNSVIRDNFIKWYSKDYAKNLESNYIDDESAKAGVTSSLSLPADYPNYYTSIINNPSPGYLYVNPHNVFHPLDQPAYSIVMDHYGTPVYYKRFPVHTLDYNIQETGELSQFITSAAGGLGIGYGSFHTYDENMNPLDTFQMGNGYLAEMHDFQLFNDGSYLLFTYDAQIVDMSQVVEGGDPAATVMGFVLQELDAEDNVVFEWSSWDHLSITDATPDIDLTGIFIDYCHGNAVERDTDGNILVSFRNTDEIIKIDRNTGSVLWRWNSNREDLNDITFLNDTVGFSHQHDIRRLENGNLTMFDNGNLHGPPPYTRMLEYTLNEVNMTAEAVSVYPEHWTPGTYFAFATGSNQRQPGGNSTIGWGVGFGKLPMVGEITADGEVTFEMFGVDTTSTYRARKYNWEPTLFSLSKDTIDWGEYSGYTPAPYILQLTNNSLEVITVSGTHNHMQEFSSITTLPVTVDPGATQNITINFFPAVEGYFEDVMTIMVAKGEYEMIGKQVVLKGYTEDESAPEIEFDPADLSENVILMPKLKMTFDEKIYKTDGSPITNNDLADIVYLKTVEENIPMKAWITWYDHSKTEIMIQPFDYLDANTLYYWGVNPDQVQDWAGNSMGDTYATFATGEEMGVHDILVSDFARVFPNPTQGMINLEFINNDEKSVMIYDLSGNEILRADQLTSKAYYFNISDQPEGIYIIQVINRKNNASVELKVIKK